MEFVSLNDPTDRASFQEALFKGVANDGKSLYMPETIPSLTPDDLAVIAAGDPVDIGKTMLRPYVDAEIPEQDLDTIVRRANTFETPVRSVGGKKVLELFHGPTQAFKDVAAAYLGSFISYYSTVRNETTTVLVATSGDTGGAIAEGLADMDKVNVVVVYGKGTVSALQQEQLRRVAKNVHSVEIEGNFNDCLALTEAAFADQEINEALHLTSANSINVGRLLPQSVYYANASSQLDGEEVRTVVPTGNLGNVTAGVIARAMGVPGLNQFIGANNINDTFTQWITSGGNPQPPYKRTMSNAMDVAKPKNLPRFQQLFNHDHLLAKQVVTAISVYDFETARTIERVHDATGYLLDPHTAVAWRAGELRGDNPLTDMIVATASPVKFAEEIYEATGIAVDNSAELAALQRRPERYTELENSFAAFKDFLATTVAN